jgi:hypothetical protein
MRKNEAVALPSFVQGDTEPVAACIGERLVELVERRGRPTRLWGGGGWLSDVILG